MTKLAALKRHATTIGLVLAALILGVVVLVIDRGEVTTKEAAERPRHLFDAWRQAEVSQLVVRSGGRELKLSRDITAEGDDALWELAIDGRAVEADEMAVSELLSTLELGTYERPVSLADRAALGLDQPALQLELVMGKLRWTMVIGGAAPSPAGASYAEIAGGGRSEPLRCVLTKQLVAALRSRTEELRSRDLAPYGSVALESLSWTDAGAEKPRWTLSRSSWGGPGGGPFALEAPAPIGQVRADHRVVDALFVALADLEAERFLEMPPESPAGASRLLLKPKQGTTGVLEIAGDSRCSGGRLVSRREPSPLSACVAQARIEALDVAADQLIDRYVVGAKRADVIELKITRRPDDDPAVEVARKGEGWHMRAPSGGAADDEAVDGWLDRVLKAQGKVMAEQETADPAALGLAEPRAQLRIISLPVRGAPEEQPERTERIDVGQPVGDKVYVYRDEDGTILELLPEAARPLAASGALLRSLQIFDHELRRFRSLTIRGCTRETEALAATSRVQQLSRERGGSWTLSAPKQPGLEADMGLANELAEKYGQLRAVRWVADQPEDSFGLAQPWCRIEAVVQLPADGDDPDGATEKTLRLTLGAKAADGYYAQQGDQPGVLVVPAALPAAAGSWLLDRAGLLLSLEPIERVVVSGKDGQAKLTVEKQADRWTLEGAGAKSAALTVRDVIKGLIAEAVLHLGPALPEEGLAEPLLVLRIFNKGSKEPLEIAVGSGDVYRETRIYYARRSGINATYAVAQARLRPLLDLL